jgi:RES domain-containing protein
MGEWPAAIQALKSVPFIEARGILARMVPLGDLIKNSPPDFLFASGKPNRYNPAGIQCVYFSENETTARLEYARQWAGLRPAQQPLVTYFAEVRLRRALDLSSGKILEILKLTPRDLRQPWRGAGKPTMTQLLGEAVSRRSVISAIRYPSEAAETAGQSGCNIVIYRNNVKRPDSVRILGPDRNPLGHWP